MHCLDGEMEDGKGREDVKSLLVACLVSNFRDLRLLPEMKRLFGASGRLGRADWLIQALTLRYSSRGRVVAVGCLVWEKSAIRRGDILFFVHVQYLACNTYQYYYPNNKSSLILYLDCTCLLRDKPRRETRGACQPRAYSLTSDPNTLN
jgi:hypothetical protein